MARSLILSPTFDAAEGLVVGLSPDDLALARRELQAGRPYHLDPAMVAEVAALHQEARGITPRALLLDVLRWLLPPAMLLALLYWLLGRE